MPELIGWLVVAGVGLLMISQAFGTPAMRAIAVLQALTPLLTVAVVVIALAALWFRSNPLAFVAGLVGVGGLILAAPLVFPPDQPTPVAGADGLRAAAVNLLYSNEEVDSVADELSRLDLDVVVFTEYTPAHHQRLTAHPLAADYPHRVGHDDEFASGMAIWSKQPMRESHVHNTVNPTLDARIAGPDGDVRVIGVHPPTPVYDPAEWASDLSAIDEIAAVADEPTLIIGDFNAAWWHPEYRRILDAGYVDAHIALGHGWSNSWPTDTIVPAFVRLDHALTNEQLVATAVDDFDVPGSDHAGFVVTVVPAA